MKLAYSYKKIYVKIVSLFYILLFVYAAVSKGLDFENFQVQLGQSPLLSPFAVWASWVVPAAELIIAMMLILQGSRRLGLYAAASLMTMFTVYIFIILHFSSFVPCSCGGILEKMNWKTHLIFNLISLVLGLSAVVLESQGDNGSDYYKKRGLQVNKILILSGSSAAVVIVLFLFSERIMHHENPFIRRYPQHPIMLDKTVDLKFNSYYFAGSTSDKIYLANYTAPLNITVFDADLKNKKTFKIVFDPKQIQFKRIRILVRGANFYLMDGTVPCVYWGKVQNWKITGRLARCNYFTIAEPIDSSHVIFRTNNGRNAANILSTYKASRMPQIIYNAALLQQQIDGVFDTDGMLVYNEKWKRIIYLYYYRNEFLTADINLQLLSRGHTIDTFSRAHIKVAYLKNNKVRTMSAPPLTVNADLAVYENLIFVKSKILGQFEDKKLWEQASIIDVYNVKKNTYLMSFAVYNIGDKKVHSFIITDTRLYALIKDELAVYKLRDILKKEMK